MYLLFVVLVYILFAIYFVDWKNWRSYYPTVQYFIICNLLYNFIFYNHSLWRYKAVTVAWLNHTLIDLTFSFLIVPVVIMIFLRYYSKGKKQFLYLAIWIAYFTAIEYLFYKKGLFIYENDWNIYWSAVFNAILFTMVRIHYKHPLMALLLSIFIIGILLFFFHPSLAELK
ncbi:CBO0543 family protein [Neobacillus drentensis]|uniref:CBO0543 family protein n=1 Tax=Neobacillus drentensis TaxID=220684 RepID=UPI002FFE89EA